MRKFVLSLFVVLLPGIQAFAQNRQVTGVVTDQSGSPVAGATVTVPGSQTGQVTRSDGRYTIQAPGDGALEFSFLGYENVIVPIEGRSVIDVVLHTSSLAIDDVVVTAVGIRRAERSLGYSVSKVDAGEGIQRAEPDLMRSLDGKIPGVVVGSPSGSAGSATRVTIRGNSSFLGNNQPLYVVDGVPYSNVETETSLQGADGGSAYGSGLSTLDPNNIESMSVLKGSAAAALYGSRAAHGVVLITTKTGSKGTGSQRGLEITFNGSYTFEQIATLPEYQNLYGQGANFAIGANNGSWGASFDRVGTQPFSDLTDIHDVYPDWAKENFPELIDKNGVAHVPYAAVPDNVKDLFRTGGMYETSLGISSNNDRGNFGMTVSRLNQEGYVPANDYERFSIAVGGNQKLSNGLRVGGNVSGTADLFRNISARKREPGSARGFTSTWPARPIT